MTLRFLPSRKSNSSTDVFGVLLLADQLNTRCRASFDLILQARPGAITEIAVLALSDQKQLLQLVECLPYGTRARVRTEVATLAFARPAMKLQTWIAVIGRYINVRVTLVVTKNYVEARLVLLDQVVFEDQCFGFSIGHCYFDVGDQLHHRRRFHRIVTAMKIARYAFLQIARLADINNFVLRIEHAIDARSVRQTA